MYQRCESARETVRNRSGNRCEKCGLTLSRNRHGKPVANRGRSIHHRKPRRLGGKDTVENMVNLCTLCHRAIHVDEKAAAERGWIVFDRDPAKAPFEGWSGWMLPDEAGGALRLNWAGGHVERVPACTTTKDMRTRPRRRENPGRRST